MVVMVVGPLCALEDMTASRAQCEDQQAHRKSTDTWVSELNAAGVPCGPIYSMDQMFEEDEVKHLGIAQDVPNAENRHLRLVGQPVTLSRAPSKMAARPPEFGEQTDEVLAEFGFGADEIVALKQAKVV
jgi:crotonobetainyl-CoA:carnitine CoA-transferase CaiB-like acyl-CoA transferase